MSLSESIISPHPDQAPSQRKHPHRPRLAVFKFASCDGCQLSLLSCEDELLAVAGKVDIVYFLEATSRIEPGPYDIALVEGSITTPHDAERIQQIRQNSAKVVTIGACATAGGIQSLKNWANHQDFLRCVYAKPEFIQTLATSTAIADHIEVDYELRGCPINRFQLLEVLLALINGRQPRIARHAVCLDCKRQGVVCVEVAQGIPCLGPVTHTGCGALCPSFDRGCYGCFGPATDSNCSSLADTLSSQGATRETLLPLFRNFNAAAPEFQRQSNLLEQASASFGRESANHQEPQQ